MTMRAGLFATVMRRPPAPKRPGELVRQGGRAWIPCWRCLGAIREVQS